MKSHTADKEEELTQEDRLAVAKDRVYVHNRAILKSYSDLLCYDT